MNDIYTYRMGGYWIAISCSIPSFIQGRGLTEEQSIICLLYKITHKKEYKKEYDRIEALYHKYFPNYYF